jgi:hypothetical protein
MLNRKVRGDTLGSRFLINLVKDSLRNLATSAVQFFYFMKLNGLNGSILLIHPNELLIYPTFNLNTL